MKRFLTWARRLNESFYKRIILSTAPSAQTLPVFRVFTGLFLLLFYCPSYAWLGDMPDAFFNPPVLSFAVLLNGFPAKPFFMVLDALLIVCAVCITLGCRTRAATWVYLVAGLTGLNFKYSFGKIDHLILMEVMLFCMSFSAWGASLALRPERAVSRTASVKSLTLLSVVVCFAFLSAGYQKAVNWINFDLNASGTAMWFYDGFFLIDRQHLLAPYLLNMPFLAFKVMDFAAVLFECSAFLFLLHSRKAWVRWLLIACVFHMLNTLILNISFVGNAAVYLVFANLSLMHHRIKALTRSSYARVAGLIALAAVVFVRFGSIFSDTLSETLFIPDTAFTVRLSVQILMWVFVLVALLKGSRTKLNHLDESTRKEGL